MSVDPQELKTKIEVELAGVKDARIVAYIRSLLVDPKRVDRLWDYGSPGQRYPCWTVLENGKVGVAYCEYGHGPKNPWGLVFLGGDDLRQAIGPDYSWYPTFADAVREEALSGLPVWRVFKSSTGTTPQAITGEGEWDDIWQQVMVLRAADPENRYDCDTEALGWSFQGKRA